MAEMKKIRLKIKSVQSTSKITKAMEMVAASKMRRAQERMRALRPYVSKVRMIAAHMSLANPEYHHPLMIKNKNAQSSGIIIVTTNKGLCGGMNTNVLRISLQKFKELRSNGQSVETTAIGRKGLVFLNRFGAKVLSQVENIGDTPHIDKLIGVVKAQIDLYSQGNMSAVYIVYTRFINTMKQEAVIEQLLPLSSSDFISDNSVPSTLWDYIYEPNEHVVIDELLIRYVESLVYQAVIENIASEHSARMVAMKAASENAKTVINELQLLYNKSRQASITKELSEIVGGASAV
ncbi:MAG: F0F1 ATP synthase subunit gamma [Burkholderia sp.]|nr:F0F1 ATP synthase subunit gamma [Burkholderia sp.]